MCGIVGVWHLDGTPVSVAAVTAMRDTLVNRGPDDAGVWTQGAVGLGHRRLSIIDLSEAGRMPMASPDQRIQCVFNGEVYNFRALREALSARGHRFASATDSEVVVRAYEEWGVACFDRFNGMFAVAIWDGREDKMVLARDPAGKKPLYYAHDPHRWLLLGSTLAPLLKYAKGALSVDEAVVRDYVRFGFPPGDKAMLQGVRTVPPGGIVTIEEGKSPRVDRYFDLAVYAEQQHGGAGSRTDESYVEELRELLRNAVAARLVSDVPLGAFLSGGVDSSLIVALMAEHGAEAVKTYTIGFEEQAFDESREAAAVAAHLGVQHTVEVLRGRDVLDQLGDVVRYFDEPMADYSVLPSLAVSKLARRHVTVALTGDGADEEFGGYRYYQAQRVFERYAAIVPHAARSALASLSALAPGAGIRRMIQRSSAVDPPTFFGLGGFYRGATSTAVGRLLGTEDSAPDRVAAFLCAHPLGNTTEAGMLYDTVHTLPQAWLHKVDRASMAVALEARSPFLDRHVLEFAFRLPLRMRIRGRRRKHIVRQLLREHLPPHLIDRPKRGFTAPMAAWLRSDLRAELQACLSVEAIRHRGFFDPAVVHALVGEHLAETHDHAQLLWALLVLEWWMQHHIEGRSMQGRFGGAT